MGAGGSRGRPDTETCFAWHACLPCCCADAKLVKRALLALFGLQLVFTLVMLVALSQFVEATHPLLSSASAGQSQDAEYWKELEVAVYVSSITPLVSFLFAGVSLFLAYRERWRGFAACFLVPGVHLVCVGLLILTTVFFVLFYEDMKDDDSVCSHSSQLRDPQRARVCRAVTTSYRWLLVGMVPLIPAVALQVLCVYVLSAAPSSSRERTRFSRLQSAEDEQDDESGRSLGAPRRRGSGSKAGDRRNGAQIEEIELRLVGDDEEEADDQDEQELKDNVSNGDANHSDGIQNSNGFPDPLPSPVAVPPLPQPVDPAACEELVAMGFTQREATDALRSTCGDMNRALQLLLRET